MDYLIPGKRIKTEDDEEEEGLIKSELFDAPFFCPQCEKPFEDEQVFNEHAMEHANITREDIESQTPLEVSYDIANAEEDEKKKIYTCRTCLEVFKSRLDAKCHQRIHEGTNPWFCELCNKHFLRKYKFARHMLTHSGTKYYECDQCGRRFNGPDYVRRHKKTYCVGNQGKRFACSICSVTFSEKRLVEAHEAIHNGTSQYHCTICDKHFLKKHTFKNHMAIHDGTRPYKCSKCDKGFIQKSDMQRHEATHDKDGPLKCGACHEEFELPEDLEMHFNMSEVCQPIACDVCGRAFSHTGNLRRHRLTHLKVRPFPCEHCDKSFLSQAELNKHLPNHSTEKTIPCPHCDLKFRTKDQLHSHKTREHGHEMETFKCEECDKVFSDTTNYHRHVRISHMKGKPYSCTMCERDFGSRSELQRHMVTGKHMRVVAERKSVIGSEVELEADEDLSIVAEQHKCEVCAKLFHNEAELQRHELVHQRVQITSQQQESYMSGEAVDSLGMNDKVKSLLMNQTQKPPSDRTPAALPRIVHDAMSREELSSLYDIGKESNPAGPPSSEQAPVENASVDQGNTLTNVVANLVGNQLVITAVNADGTQSSDVATMQLGTEGQQIALSHDEVQQLIQQALLQQVSSQGIVIDEKTGEISYADVPKEIIYLQTGDGQLTDATALLQNTIESSNLTSTDQPVLVQDKKPDQVASSTEQSEVMPTTVGQEVMTPAIDQQAIASNIQQKVIASTIGQMTEDQAVFAAAIDSLSQVTEQQAAEQLASVQHVYVAPAGGGPVEAMRTRLSDGTLIFADGALTPEALQQIAGEQVVFQVENSQVVTEVDTSKS